MEWMPSASIEEAPVRKNARNFISAMPVFASRAAMTALLPPSADTADSSSRRGLVGVSSGCRAGWTSSLSGDGGGSGDEAAAGLAAGQADQRGDAARVPGSA